MESRDATTEALSKQQQQAEHEDIGHKARRPTSADRGLKNLREKTKGLSYAERKGLEGKGELEEPTDRECDFLLSFAGIENPPFKLTFELLGLDKEQSEALQCFICKELVNMPICCQECDCVTCAECFRDARTKTNACPKCKEELNPGSVHEKKREAFEQKLSCPYCEKPFKFNEWREHRYICEQARLSCACGQITSAFHQLDENGNLSDHLTSFRQHLIEECELATSNCRTCGLDNMTKEQFKTKHNCSDYQQELYDPKGYEHRRQILQKQAHLIKRGERMICILSQPLTRHHGAKPDHYSSKLYCNSCRGNFDPTDKLIDGNYQVYYRCSCKCDFDLCRQCATCPSDHLLEFVYHRSFLQEKDKEITCSLCCRKIYDGTGSGDEGYFRCREQCIFNACKDCKMELHCTASRDL